MCQKQLRQLAQAQLLRTLRLKHPAYRGIGLRLIPKTHLRTLFVLDQVGDLDVRLRSVFGKDGRDDSETLVAGFGIQFPDDFQAGVAALRQHEAVVAGTAGNVYRLLYSRLADGLFDLAVLFRVVAGARVFVEEVNFVHRYVHKQAGEHVVLGPNVHISLRGCGYQQAGQGGFNTQLRLAGLSDGFHVLLPDSGSVVAAHDRTSAGVLSAPVPDAVSSGSRFSSRSPNRWHSTCCSLIGGNSS